MAAPREIIDVDAENCPTPPPPLHPQDPKSNRTKSTTRKRKKVPSVLQNLKSVEEKQAYLETLEKELDALFRYYKEAMAAKVRVDLSQCGGSRNVVVAALMEESDLPLSRLVDEILDKLNGEISSGAVVLADSVTYATVKSSVLFVGQRMVYGVPNPDADVLEDHVESCLWCWETRDLKLLPKSVRGLLGVRRTCRRRIHERIMAVSEMIASLKKLETEPDYNDGLIKGSASLSKAFPEADIRLLVDSLLQKNSEDMDKKRASQENKLLIKQFEKNRREAEKEKEKESKHNELQRETLLNESNLKLSQEEARNDEKSCEKKKQHKKQVDEAEKDQRRREKAEAELKKKRSLQKQASIMERFLKRSKINPPSQNDKVSIKSTASDLSSSKSESLFESATVSMDCTLASSSNVTLDDIRKSHFSSWHRLGQSLRSNRKQRWGLRQKPRTEAFKELKLTAIKTEVHDELDMEKHVDRLGECSFDNSTCPMNTDSSLDAKKYSRGRQLLQFDKSHRPAFYGVWPTKSNHVGPRHPLRKDPSLDYEVSSDEEWEEEEPGESLSDCDKDEEECQEECSKSDEESEDGFFVPDGYLSEDEGAQVDRMEIDDGIEGADSSPSCKNDTESEEFFTLLRQQKHLNNLTEHALRKNQPLIISNLIQDKFLSDPNFSATLKPEQMCLQALSMYLIPGGSCIEISMDQTEEDKEVCLAVGKSGASPISGVTVIPDLDLSTIVTAIQNCSQGMNKVLASLQQKFPSVSKSSLKNKVREVSDYVDNRLQVKKEVLDKLGLAVKPEKSSGGPRSIAAFFSKRCLPPAGQGVKPGEVSPLPSLKSSSAIDERPQSSYNI
ncbi:hypothetical protein VNO78_15169 [Psophocarpus tetragonolobus]|uniref:Chromatin assembly factor 1 subunit FAS1 n=1 Tax=Psophocarpus tetragonolobus TaxID=3891 RepID=A0AAN9SE48_PSOTE